MEIKRVRIAIDTFQATKSRERLQCSEADVENSLKRHKKLLAKLRDAMKLLQGEMIVIFAIISGKDEELE